MSVITRCPKKRENTEKQTSSSIRVQEPNGGPSPIPYGFEGRTGICMGTMTGEVVDIVD